MLRIALCTLVARTAAFAPTPPQRSPLLRASEEPFDVGKLQGKAERIKDRRAQIYEEHQQRKGGEIYDGDGLLLDNRLDAGIDFSKDVIDALADLVQNAVETSTGEGTESSGNGRYAWGTWVDTEKVAAVRAAVDAVRFRGSKKLWASLSEGGAFQLARGAAWDITLRCWGEGSATRDVEQMFLEGSHVFIKPLAGTVVLQKLRRGRDGEMSPLGPKKELRGASRGVGGSSSVGAVAKMLGGPPQRLTAQKGPTAVLEVVLRSPIGSADEGREALEKLLSEDVPIEVRRALIAFEDNAPIAEEEEEEEELEGNAALLTQEALKERVGGLEEQLDAIVRRVLASRASPEAAKRLGVGHVRGVLLSGPPGCGKTLLARELARALGAREPQIVNGPEILDKFVGEAERKVRELFAPAEAEFNQVGDASALHVIVFDEMDAIARRRGSLTGDTTGVRDGVVNQLLAKMDGVVEAPNVLVVGCTNRPELIDEALMRPGRLEVQLQVRRPDAIGRRDIARIHTRQMKENGALALDAQEYVDDMGGGLASRTDLFSGAEIAGLVRAAASRALAQGSPTVSKTHLADALQDIAPQATRADGDLARRAPHGLVDVKAHASVRSYLNQFLRSGAPGSTRSVLLVPEVRGAGCTAHAAVAARDAARDGAVDAVAFQTAYDLLRDGASPSTGLAAAFDAQAEHAKSVLVLDDVDSVVDGPATAALRALCRRPPAAGDKLYVVATAADPSAACGPLSSVFDETLVVPALRGPDDVARALAGVVDDAEALVAGVGDDPYPVKALLRVAERASATARDGGELRELFNAGLADHAAAERSLAEACRIY